MKRTIRKTSRFSSVLIGLASPDKILSWSFGEIKNPETIDYRTQKAKLGGLFDEVIFGPESDFQCSSGCGKYKGMQYHGIVCDKCGVEVTRSSVRRERMGHIDLATPVAHIWYLRKTPSKIAQLLGISAQKLQKVIYYSSYIVNEFNEDMKKEYIKKIKEESEKEIKKATRTETKTKLKSLEKDRLKDIESVEYGSIIDETTYYVLNKQFPRLFVAEKGGEAIYKILKDIDLNKLEKKIVKELETAPKAQHDKLRKQLVIVRSFQKSGDRPEWMFLTRLPVIPAGIRPLVALDGGKYASSDLNDLYRLVIIRNNRLKEFIENKAPRIFIDTQKRLVQEAVDSLLDNSINKSTKPSFSAGKSRELKSIAEYLGGKKGMFRENLLGKRVDYSGRTVVVVGPQLRLNECGIPKDSALELFRPFVIADMIEKEVAYNVRSASRMIEDRDEIVWESLDRVIKEGDKHVLLNRQPTLHRQGIQAFKPILIEGKAIELHPLVCTPYNADFDGDQMNIHLPLSDEAQAEAKNFLVSTNNVVKAGTGNINATPANQDIILGCYWATKMKDSKEEKYFSGVSDAITSYDYKKIGLRERIFVVPGSKPKYKHLGEKPFETNIGRILFNNKLPADFPFVNEELTGAVLKKTINDMVDIYGIGEAVKYFDAIKDFGFKYASRSGTTFAWSDLNPPKSREAKIEEGHRKIAEIEQQYEEGFISLQEKKRKNVEIWQSVREDMESSVSECIPEDSPLGDMIVSGARGNIGGLTQMVGMLGIIDSAKGEPIEHAITSSMKAGLTPIEYFFFSFGARKGLADTAIKTADAGYLSRRLFDVAQEVNVVESDCKTTRGFRIYRKSATGLEVSFARRIKGRFASEDIVGKDGVLVKKNSRIGTKEAEKIESDESIDVIRVRSPITCRSRRGVCAKCYGDDVSVGKTVDMGEAVGTIAAQSIGEPGTQLTMRTFHAGGIASVGGDITSGLPRVKEIFDRRVPKALALISHIDGKVASIEKLESGTVLITIDPEGKKATSKDCEYSAPPNRHIIVKVGDKVEKGQFLTDGSANLEELLKYSKKERTQEYIFNELSKVYELQGENLIPVHFEVIIRQMFSRLEIIDPGDSTFIEGEEIEINELADENEALEKAGKKPIIAENLVNGIINISTSRSNFLSSASFQNTTNVLIRAALNGSEDTLDGLKENVIIGRLVPVGSGFESSKKWEVIEEVKEEVEKREAARQIEEAEEEEKKKV